MLDELVTAYGNRFLVAALGVSLALLGLFVVLWLLRHRAPSPFVRGGRNRQPRLQVLDAAAIDARRRLVLVRRDNIEHLVMIGGPTDIVIESGIGEDRPYISVQPPAESLAAAPPAPAAEPVTVTAPPEARRVAAPTAAPLPRMAPASIDEHAHAATPSMEARNDAFVSQPVRPVAAPVTPAPAVTMAPAHQTSPTPREQPASVRPAPPAVQHDAPQPIVPRPPVHVQEPAIAAPKVEDVLDMARQRVLPVEASVTPQASAPVAAPPARPAPAATPMPDMAPARSPDIQSTPKTVPTGEPDFEKFLEDEMTSHLEAVKASRSEQMASRPAPTVLPPAPPVSAAISGLSAPRPAAQAMPSAPTPGAPSPQAQRPAQPPKEEPNLQQEIARIFGEMTAGRND